VAHCLGEIEHSVKLLPENAPVLKAAVEVLRKLKATDFSDQQGAALHDFIDELQIQLEDVHRAISNAWFSPGES
jgi:uncharacterized alpha-E superfamily protein